MKIEFLLLIILKELDITENQRGVDNGNALNYLKEDIQVCKYALLICFVSFVVVLWVVTQRTFTGRVTRVA